MEVVMSNRQKCVFEKKQKTNIKAFNMITNKNEAKTMAKHISCDCKCKFNSTTCNSNQKWNKKTCKCECKNDRKSKKNYSWNSSICICENSKYLKSIADTSVTECDEIISVMDIASTTKNCHSKKARYKFDCYILHTVLLVIIFILIITIICYYYADQEGINALTI